MYELTEGSSMPAVHNWRICTSHLGFTLEDHSELTLCDFFPSSRRLIARLLAYGIDTRARIESDTEDPPDNQDSRQECQEDVPSCAHLLPTSTVNILCLREPLQS
jgi:hypothetical protein